MKEYLEKVYNFIFEPNHTFSTLKDHPRVSQGLFTLVWVNILMYSLKYVFTGDPLNVVWYFFTLLKYIITVVIAWFVLGLFFEYIAKIFARSGKLKTLLFLTSFSVLPWVFLAPLELLKQAADIGYFFAVLFEIIIYFWTIFLYCKSLEITYDLRFSRAVMLIFLPFIASFFAFAWSIGFISKLIYIFNV